MIVECHTCHTRFRLDESRIQGRGARMRCRKCGEAIIVMKDPGDHPAPPPKNLFDLRSVLRHPESRTGPFKEHRPGAEKPPSPAAGWRPVTPETEIPAPREDLPQEEPASPKIAEEPAELRLREAAQEEAVSLRAEGEPPREPEQEAAGQAIPVPGDNEEGPEPEIPTAHEELPQEESAAGEPWEEPAEIEMREAPQGEAVSLRAEGEPPREPEQEAAGQTVSAPEEEEEAPEPEIPAAHEDAPQEEPAAREAREEGSGTDTDDLFASTSFALEKEPHPVEERPFELMLNDSDSLDFLKEDHRRAEPGSGFDISGNLRCDPSVEEEQPKKAPEFVTLKEPPEEVMPDRLEAIQRELREIGGGSPDVPDTPPPSSAAVTPVPPVRKMPAPPAAAAPRETAHMSKRTAVLTFLLLFLVIAGGGAYLGFTPGGQENLRRLFPLMESLWLGSEQTAPRYAMGNLIGYYEPNAKSGKLFVIKGSVTNQGRKKRSGIRVGASLFDRNGQQLGQMSAFAGNVLTGEDLRNLTRDTIEKGMANRWGDRLANLDVAPGKSIPFMVVFFDAPEGIEEYRTEARDVE